MASLNAYEISFIFGLLGNIISFLVFLAPVPTFATICKAKSSDGFQSMPYAVALLSAELLLFYGILKTNANLIIIINAIGCLVELVYLIIYMVYASKKAKMLTTKVLLVFNLGYGALVGLTLWLLNGPERVNAVGWTCAVFNIAVFAAPLGIMRKVIRTKSVQFMPFALSFFLTLCAVMWFFYGIFVHDLFIALPNVLGFLFGIAQMILYMVYKNAEPNSISAAKQAQPKDGKLSSTNSTDVYPAANPSHSHEMKLIRDVNRATEQSNDDIV